MISFVHTADIHFGVENYGRIDPSTGIHSRLLDFKKSLQACVDYAIEQDVDFFMFSGDAYKTAHPSPTQQKLFLQQFLRLYQHNIPVVIVVGNHDHPMSFGKAHALDVFGDLPVSGFYTFSRPDILRLQTKRGLVQIVGIPWPSRHSLIAKTDLRFKNSQEIVEYLSSSVASIIQDLAAQLDPFVPAVLAGHLTVSEGIFSGSERTAILGSDPILFPSQLAIEPFDYVALGHLHRFQDLNRGGRCPIVYSGSLERIDFGERNDTKGFCHVKIDEHKKTTYSFIHTPTRPMIQCDVQLHKDENQTQQIIAALRLHDLKDAIVKIVYHIPEDMNDVVELPAIQAACKDAWYVSSITPVHKPKQREKRAQVSVQMDDDELLRQYLKMKNCSPEILDSLLKKAENLKARYEEIQTLSEGQ
ncbi:exonuclease SbcCD subunit D [Candidatus Dependentiae bacterium]|nr:exonuclease SbcCD subunit D [Candidatus Dependentiae bacterium]